MSEYSTLSLPGPAGVVSPTGGRRLPELLAPAGDWECARAAVENGADAIYFGLDRFNARMRAHNFTEAALPKLMEFLHRRGVRGYVTFNTLVFPDELADAEEYLRSIIAAGVDAAIVQDVGICRLIRRLSPDFPIHASTQMTVTSVAGVEFARELGCNLVVLARECSIKEIEKIQAAQREHSAEFKVQNEKAGGMEPGSELPLEVFVHGALCVAYSGQCLTSESLGGRSANRGECAQACRMPYELVSDGQTVPLGDRRYLLSPQDLAGLEVLPDLIRNGLASLKIEGRLKSPEYVANITRVYRKALDKLSAEFAGRNLASNPAPAYQPTSDEQYDLEMGFSRGLFTGWFRGVNNQELAHARFGKKRGVFLGEVLRVSGEHIAVRLKAPLQPGDGIVFDAGQPDQPEEGGRVYEVRLDERGEATLAFGQGDIDFKRVKAGQKLWKTDDPQLNRRLRQTFAGEKLQFMRPVNMEVHGHEGQPLTLIVRDEQGHVSQVTSSMPLARAEKHPLGTERLTEQFGRLGGSPFKLGTLKNHLEGDVLIPVSELNRLRREAVADLEAQRIKPRRWQLLERTAGNAVRGIEETAAARTPVETAQLIVLVRNLAQLDAAVRCGVTTLYCEFEDPKKYREAVTRFHEGHAAAACRNPSSSIGHPSPSIWAVPPRITKMGEEWILKQVRSCNADGYLVRNYDHLQDFADVPRTGDFSLNVANALSAGYFKSKFGLERLTASYDLNVVQLESLLQSAPPEWFEITIHQHMPMFHMEHCVFCAFLSKGTDFTNCGRPCDTHEVKLRDRVGAEHPLKADAGCRNTVFNSRAQTGAEYVARLLQLGARHFRIEFVGETPAEVERTIGQYRRLLRGEISGTDLWRELKLLSQLGVTRGQMENLSR